MELTDRQYKDACKVISHLEEAGYTARMAGGCVRDRLLGVSPKDFDVATDATPEQVSAVFKPTKMKVVPTGIDHGTMTVVLPSGPVEVTTLRLDVATDGRRAEVKFGNCFEEDALRRDFTINAMFEDRDGKIYDYFGGQDDLKNKVLRFVGDPGTRIQEDYLRILRLYRFWARLGFAPAEDARQAVTQNLDGLPQLSQERVTSELLLILSTQRPCAAVEALIRDGVWEVLFPQWQLSPPLTILDAELAVSKDVLPLLRLATINGLSQSPLESKTGLQKQGSRLRLSTAQIKKWQALILGSRQLPKQWGDDDVAALLWLDHWESFSGSPETPGLQAQELIFGWQHLLTLGSKPVPVPLQALATMEKKCGHRRIAKLPVTGGDVMAELGLSPGTTVKEWLEKLRQAYYREEWTTKEEGLAWLKTQAPQT